MTAGVDSQGNLHDENGQFVSISTLFERERLDHQKEHDRERIVVRETAERLAREVAATEFRLERRLDTMNEFRLSLQDQANRHVTRDLFDSEIAPLKEFRSRAIGASAILAIVAGAVGAAIMKVISG